MNHLLLDNTLILTKEIIYGNKRKQNKIEIYIDNMYSPPIFRFAKQSSTC